MRGRTGISFSSALTVMFSVKGLTFRQSFAQVDDKPLAGLTHEKKKDGQAPIGNHICEKYTSHTEALKLS